MSGDGRFCFAFKEFKDHIDDTSTSTETQKLCAGILWKHAKAEDLPLIHYGEWHHLWPLCCFGSVEDDENYRRVSLIIHIQCHTALAYLFPFIPGLLHSLRLMLNLKSIDVKSISDIPNETLKQCLDDTGLIVENLVRLTEAARKLVAEKNQSLWNERFEQLLEFEVEFGHYLVPQRYAATPALGGVGYDSALQLQAVSGKKAKFHDRGAYSITWECWIWLGDK